MPIALLHVCIEKKRENPNKHYSKMKYYEIDVMHEVTFVPGILSNCLTSNTINYSKFALV